MTDRNLTVARLVEDHIDGITVEGDAFGGLFADLGIAPTIESQHVVTSSEAGGETRAEDRQSVTQTNPEEQPSEITPESPPAEASNSIPSRAIIPLTSIPVGLRWVQQFRIPSGGRETARLHVYAYTLPSTRE